MDLTTTILTFFGGTTVMLGAAAYLAKSLVSAMLARDLKQVETELRLKGELELARAKDAWASQSNKELELFRTDLALMRDRAGWQHQTAAGRDERLRAEILRWANPILAAVSELAGRLDNILGHGAHVALGRNTSRNVSPGWSIDYDYFMPSTLYVFAQYFHWVRRLQIELSFELFASQSDKDAFLAHVDAVRDALSRWPMQGLPGNDPTDAQVFTLQQRAIASAMTIRAEPPRCLEFDEFMEAWLEPPLADALRPLQTLLQDVSATSGARWIRLQRVLASLKLLEQHCKAILGMPPPVPAV